MEQMDKNQWIEEVLNSAENIHKVDPSHKVWSKIQGRLSKKTISLRTVYAAAAGIALLIFANTMLLTKQADRQEPNAHNGMESVIDYYGLDDQDLNYGI